MQNLHPSQQLASSDENYILDALVSLSERGCHLTFTWCPSHSSVRGGDLADMVAKERTTVKQEEENQHYDSARAAIRQANKEPPIAHEYLRRIDGKKD